MKKFMISLSVSAFILGSFLPSQAYAARPYEGGDGGQINNWRRSSSELSRKVDALDNDAEENLPMPILFGLTPNNLTKNFGDPRSGGRTHEGLDIMAPKGAPVVTPTDAVVIRVGNGDSSGYNVYTANPGGETFAYMHLDAMSELEEGDEIKKGDLIGYVGNTGNASGGATHLHFEIRFDGEGTDPYPRLTRIFPLADKIEYLENILNDRSDEKEFAEQMVKMYRKEFVLAKNLTASGTLNITLPDEIEKALTSVPAVVVKSPVGNTSTNGNLTIGAKGAAVVTLQKYLINKNVGSANLVKADGSFGPITQKALAQFQASVGISPAVGYYGPITRAYVDSHPYI